MITSDELKRIARLAKLSLVADEMDALMADMPRIYNVVQPIADADLSSFDCTADDEETAVLRDDTVLPSLPLDEVLANAGEQRDGYFIGPAVGEKAE